MSKTKKIRCMILITSSTYLVACSSFIGGQPNLGSVLPIKIGIYVDRSQTCADPANAGILSFDGDGLNGAHTHDCHLKIKSQQGKLFAYAQQCVDAGVGDGPISLESGLLSVDSEKRFTPHRKNDDAIFEYCEPSTLPAGITVPKPK